MEKLCMKMVLCIWSMPSPKCVKTLLLKNAHYITAYNSHKFTPFPNK